MKFEISKTFFVRVFWSKHIANLSMYVSLFFIFGIFVDDVSRQMLFLIGGLTFFVRLLMLFFDNVSIISFFEIDSESRLLHFDIKRFDRIIHTYSLPIEEVGITIKESFLLDIYTLQLSHFTFTHKQKEIGGWSKEMFKKMVIEFNKLKGKKSYLSYVR